MDGWLRDLKQGFRMLVRTPLLSLVSILTIGLGVGGVTFGFSVLYGTLLRPLPVRDAERLITMYENRTEEGIDQMGVPLHDLIDIRDQQTSFEYLNGMTSGTMNLAGDEGPPERFQGSWVTSSTLAMLGVPPILGRTFVDEDDDPAAAPTVVIGYTVWRDRFGSDPDLVGRTVRLNGETTTIVGVMPEGFHFPFEDDLWMPLRDDPATLPRRGRPLQVIGYVREGTSIPVAEQEVQRILARVAAQYPDENEGVSGRVQLFQEANMPSQIRLMMLMMMGMVSGVLLIACANVANVLMARAAVRDREVAIRSAMGADRWRVIRQLLAEAVALGIVGGVVGIFVASIGLRFFDASVQDVGKPYWIYFSLDGVALLFTTGVTLLAAVAAGTLPAFRASGTRISTVLRDESRGSSSIRLSRFSSGLVVAELAISCALMVASGLLVRALVDLNRAEMGFRGEQVMTFRLGLFETDYPDEDSRNRFFHDLLERLSAEPGIASATLAQSLPASGGGRRRVEVEGEAYATDRDVPTAMAGLITPGFFETFQVPLRDGRDFRLSETRRDGDPVVIVNRSFVDRHLSDGGAVGRQIRLWNDAEEEPAPWLRVVGVVDDVDGGVNPFAGGDPLSEGIYLPLGQGDARFMSVAVRTVGPPTQITAVVRRAVGDVDPNLPLYWVRTMDEVVDQSIFFHKIFGIMFAIFGATALFLAAVGLYGVIDFSVSSRIRELGVRMAMGAQGRDVLRLVLRRVLIQLGVGMVVGLGLGAALSVPLAAALYGVESWDAIVYGLIVGTLVLTALTAALGPALKAIRVDPVVALQA
jgi:predicted permease